MNRIVFQSRVALGAAALLLASCPGPKRPGPVNTEREPYVAAFADCAASTAKEFKTAADALVSATAAHASAPTAQSLADARAAFHVAMDGWQVNELLRFGPAAPSTTAGGMDLRDQIYSWPLASRCAVEEEIVAKGYETNSSALLINRRGLAALEYLLFYEGGDTACPGTSPIVSGGSWAALSAAERDARKRLYAAKVAEDVASRAGQLVQAWDPAGGNFKSKMLGTEVFPTTQRALNAVSDAMFYVDDELKHMKLEAPLGLRTCTPGTLCPELLESRYAHRSRRNIEANMRGFRKVMYGCGPNDEGQGFADLLVSVNQAAVVDHITAADAQITAALAAVAPADFDTALTAETGKVRAVHEGFRVLGSTLKSEFVTVLDLELPMSLEGDND